jgi:hypothetical protein
MTDPSEKYKDLDFLITRIGMPAVILGLVMWFHWHEFRTFARDMAWKLERSIRNERAIMQKLGIPIILDGEKLAKDN